LTNHGPKKATKVFANDFDKKRLHDAIVRVKKLPSFVIVDQALKGGQLCGEYDFWVQQPQALQTMESYNILVQKVLNFEQFCTPSGPWRYPQIAKSQLPNDGIDLWERVKNKEDTMPMLAFFQRLQLNTSILSNEEDNRTHIYNRPKPIVSKDAMQCMTCGFEWNPKDESCCLVCHTGHIDMWHCYCGNYNVGTLEDFCRKCRRTGSCRQKFTYLKSQGMYI